MKRHFLTVKSVTFAMKGKEILTQRGISATVQRTPKLSQTESCGYSIAVPSIYKDTALGILSDHGIVVTGVQERGVI